MSRRYLYIFPIALMITFNLSLIICFSIAVELGHIQPYYSYISDAGTIPPESCIFAQLLAFVCILYYAVVYIRYLQVKEYLHLKLGFRNSRVNLKVNLGGLVIGIISVFGISLVANFQEKNVISVHLLGAFLTFFGGSVWFLIQGYFTLIMTPHFGSAILGYFRIGLSIVGLILYLTCQTTGVVSLSTFYVNKRAKNRTGKSADPLHWKPEDGAWELRGVSVISEWLIVALFDCYILTFIPEFKQMEYKSAKLVLIGLNERKSVSTILAPIPLESIKTYPEATHAAEESDSGSEAMIKNTSLSMSEIPRKSLLNKRTSTASLSNVLSRDRRKSVVRFNFQNV